MIPVDTGDAPVRALFTTRHGGVSTGPFASLNLGATTGDSAESVRANREVLADVLGVDAARVAVAMQVHGAAACSVGPDGGDGRFTGSLEGVSECDALVTRSAGIPVLAMGADCPVVCMWDSHGEVVAAVHAGWRGLVAGVIRAAVDRTGASPGVLHAAVGPHVRPCCYPVDVDLRRTMATTYGDDVVHGDAIDLGRAARRALETAGVAPERIRVEDACTSCDARRFFSYRRDGAATGRQAAIIWIEETGS